MQFMQRSIAAQQEQAKAEKEALLQELAGLDGTGGSDSDADYDTQVCVLCCVDTACVGVAVSLYGRYCVAAVMSGHKHSMHSVRWH
jgi:hypothetical protein